VVKTTSGFFVNCAQSLDFVLLLSIEQISLNGVKNCYYGLIMHTNALSHSTVSVCRTDLMALDRLLDLLALRFFMFVVLFLSVFSYCYVRQTKLASSLANFWAHNKIVFDLIWFDLFQCYFTDTVVKTKLHKLKLYYISHSLVPILGPDQG